MHRNCLLGFLAFFGTISSLLAADLDVLVIGSTHSYSEGGESGVVHEKPFNPTTIATRLQSILSQDSAITDTVNVEFEDIYKTKTMDTAIGGSGTIWSFNYRCYSLMQHFVWPENKATRLANLRGEGDHVWDYIVLCGDPYVMANFPGVYAEGVRMIQGEIANSANPAQLLLLAQWPENGPGFSADDFNEIVHRVGNSGNLSVVPAGKAWDGLTNLQDVDANHPTPKGEYLAAACIYSKIFNRSAETSAYTYPTPDSSGDAIADHALSVVQATVPADEVVGEYTTENAFQMKYYRGRQVDWNEYGTSTEEGFANGLKDAFTAAKVSNVRRNPPSSGNPVDLSYSRGTDAFEPEKQYQVNAAKHDRVHGFPMGDHRNTGPTTMIYGIDKRYNMTYGGYFGNGTDLGVAYSMVREGEVPLDVRGIPVRLMWSKINHFQPSILSHRDGWHLSNELDRAVGAYMYTLLSGRCPVDAEPADNTSTDWKRWWCRKLGYETAWQMAHLTTRAPGFRVCPSSATALSVTPATTETMTVEFVYPPQGDVTVTVSCSNDAAAIVGPKTLVFTPANFNTPQQVTVAGIPGAAASEAFEVNFTTASGDHLYDGLSDSWAYTTTRSSPGGVSQVDNGVTDVTAIQDTPVAINLNAAGSNAGNTILIGPSHGSVTWSGSGVIEYTPGAGYIGSDQIVYAATVSGTQTIGCLDITVELPNGQVSATAGDASASEQGPDPGTFVITRFGDSTAALDVLFSMSGTAVLGSDYTLSHASPVTIPAGQSSVTITLTPVDDPVFGERDESAVLTITEDPAYPIGAASAVITIADNDNNAPTADAGTDQTVLLDPAASAGADPVAGADIFLDAGQDEDSGVNNVWEDTLDKWDLTIDTANVSLVADAGSSLPGISSAYDFAGGVTGGGGGCDGTSLHDMGGGVDTNPITLELWFKPDSTADDGQTNGQILWETGGTTGLGIFYNDGVIEVSHDGNQGEISHDVSALTGEFIQVVVTYDTDTDPNSFKLYINGGLEVTASRNDGDLCGGDGSGLGNRGESNAGGRGSGDSGTASFDGKIAIFRSYHGRILDAAEVMTNYDSVATAGAAADLDGTAGDVDGDPITTTWSVVSQPDPSLVTFGDASAIDTTARFDTAGTYVLRLTVDDGVAQASSEIEITVIPPLPEAYVTWAGGALFGSDNNGDGVENGLAWILGAADPSTDALGKLPVTADDGTNLTLDFARVDSHAPAKLFVQYGSDLENWTELEIPATSGTIGGDIEVVVNDGSPDTVTVKIPTATHEASGKLFTRLGVSEN